MKYSKNNAQNNNKKNVLAIIIVLILIGLGVYAYISIRGIDTEHQENGGINYDPPSEEERQAGDKQKARISEDNDSKAQNNEDSSSAANNSESKDKQPASVIIVDANQYNDVVEARAFISDYFQKGTCTFTFTQNELVFTKETEAYTDARTTNCRNLSTPVSDFPNAGEWRLVVTYESDNAKGKSDSRALTIK